LAVVALTAASGVVTNLYVGIGLPLAVLLASGLMAHGRLYADRPPVSNLTEFYLWISVGGAVGGMLAAFVAPVAFNSIAEYPIALVATALLLTGQIEPRKRAQLVLAMLFAALVLAAVALSGVNAVALAIGAAGAVAFLLAGRSAWFAPLLGVALLVAFGQTDGRILAQERTFYGVYRVLATDDGDHMMVSGTTIHGVQRFEPAPTLEPLAYYVEDGPFGQLMTGPGSDAQSIGVIGLGAGALASYLEPGQKMTFFEIDPAVVELAENRDLFTLTSAARGEVHFVAGDGRLTIQQSEETFDLVIIDAFTSDAIPTHLVTTEAIDSYLQALSQDGVIGFHISNRHFDLEPVVGRIAQHLGLSALASHYQPTTSKGSPVSLVVLAREATALSAFAGQPGWQEPRVSEDLWTDEFSNLLSVLR
jgi:spermidine synthase